MRRPSCALHAALRVLLAGATLFGALSARAGAPAADVSSAVDSVGPVPDWVDRFALQASDLAATSGSDGVVEELIDDQVRVTDTVERYRRVVRKLTDTSGVEGAGQVEISFDPAYEHLRLHGVAIVREGQRIDALKSATVRTLQKESDLDELVYNGELTALVVVNDLRVGDTLDVEYTLTGSNPVFDGKFVADERLSTRHGAEHLRLRVLLPKDRAIVARPVGLDLAPVEHEGGGVRELVWDRRSTAPRPEDDQLPVWFEPTPYVTFSELSTWGDVARWASAVFAKAMQPSPPVAAKAAELAASAKGRDAQTLAALRFVQDDVRYLGIEMGSNSHRPHDSAQVLVQRFGDCKDKSVLLVSLLRALGIDAEPALVSTWLRARTSAAAPSPLAFDHVIVHVPRAGGDLWLDPTRTQERGPLGDAPLPYGRALIVDPNSADLTAIPEPALDLPTTESRETFVFDGPSSALEVMTTYRGLDADDMRKRLGRTPPAKMSATALEYYASVYPGIQATSPMSVVDDANVDRIVTTERYTIKDPLGQGGLDLFADTVRESLDKPHVTHRTAPLAVPFPLFRRDEVVVEGVSLYGLEDEILHDDALDFTRRTEVEAGRMHVTFELRSKGDSVPLENVAAHVALVSQILDATSPGLGVRHVEPTHAQAEAVETRWLPWAWGAVAAFVAIMLSVVIFRRVRKWRRRRKVQVRAGETAATPRVAKTRALAEQILVAPKCSCGGAFAAKGEWTTVTYGERAVTAGRATCGSCGERRLQYFAGLED